jgi:hypothetical protein
MTTFFTREIILPSTTYGVPSGKYDGSSQDWFSDSVIAANYYGGYRSNQTFITDLSLFSGKITLQGTLNSPEYGADWFDIVTYNYIDSPDITEVLTENSIGNFVWLRARIEGFTTGTINSITVSY